jgi:hypothetical protein
MESLKEKIEKFKREKGHFIENQWFPRVTSIIEVKAKPGLYKFYAESLNFQEANRKKGLAGSEGTKIHEAIEEILAGRTPIVEDEFKPSIKAFMDFLKQNELVVEKDFIEKRLLSKNFRYTGTFDFIGYVNGKFSVVDIKTSSSIYKDYGLQTSAYLYALNEYGSIFDSEGRFVKKIPKEIESRFILLIRRKRICEKCGAEYIVRSGREPKIENGDPNCEHKFGEIIGEFELKEFENHTNDFKAFLACKDLWEWENEFFLKQIGYL